MEQQKDVAAEKEQLQETEEEVLELTEPLFEPSDLPDFTPDYEKLRKLREKGTVKKGLWGILYLHSKTIINCIMIVFLAGIVIGWLINSALMAVISLAAIAICIILNYTVINL